MNHCYKLSANQDTFVITELYTPKAKGGIKVKKKMGVAKKILIAIAGFFLFIIILGLFGNEDSSREEVTNNDNKASTTEAPTNTPTEISEKQSDTEDKTADYVTCLQQEVDKYMSGVHYPWSFDEYMINTYNDGTTHISTYIEIDGIVEKQLVNVNISLLNDNYNSHYVKIGGKVYFDDGTTTE